MSDVESWIPAAVDLDRPNAARMYDYWLGGAHNFTADRQAANEILDVAPEVQAAARANRHFLYRAVMFCLDAGIRQFLDLGSGIPTVGNVHEVAHGVDPAARVVYVDHEPVAVAHTGLLLGGLDTAAVVQADIRDPDVILEHADTRRLIDFGQPVAVLLVSVLLVSVLHFVPGDLTAVVGQLRRRLRAGGFLVVSHASRTEATTATEDVQHLYTRTPTPLQLRSRDEIRALLSGLDLIHPDPHSDVVAAADLVPVTDWRPDARDTIPLPAEVAASPFLAGFLAAVGRMPSPPATATRAAGIRVAATKRSASPVPANRGVRFDSGPRARRGPTPAVARGGLS